MFACEKLGQVHVMMFVLGENLGLMRFAASEQQPTISLASAARWSSSRAPHTLKNTNLIFFILNFLHRAYLFNIFFKGDCHVCLYRWRRQWQADFSCHSFLLEKLGRVMTAEAFLMLLTKYQN